MSYGPFAFFLGNITVCSFLCIDISGMSGPSFQVSLMKMELNGTFMPAVSEIVSPCASVDALGLLFDISKEQSFFFSVTVSYKFLFKFSLHCPHHVFNRIFQLLVLIWYAPFPLSSKSSSSSLLIRECLWSSTLACYGFLSSWLGLTLSLDTSFTSKGFPSLCCFHVPQPGSSS
jgi:hypothetical protein